MIDFGKYVAISDGTMLKFIELLHAVLRNLYSQFFYSQITKFEDLAMLDIMAPIGYEEDIFDDIDEDDDFEDEYDDDDDEYDDFDEDDDYEDDEDEDFDDDDDDF